MASNVRRLHQVCASTFSRLSLHTRTITQPKLCRLHRNMNAGLSSRYRCFSSVSPLSQKETVTIYFVNEDGEKIPATANIGDNLLDVVIENDIDIDGFGACEGTLACSTCHLIFKPEHYASLPEKPTDEELDMLDLAYGLSDTSRLGCQIIVSKDMDGWEVSVPEGVADARG